MTSETASRGSTRIGLWATAICAVLLAAACSSSGDGGGPGGPTKSAATGAAASIRALVPASVKSKGSVTVAVESDFPPMTSFGPDGKTIVGADIDTIKALEPLLGIKLVPTLATFDSFLPSLQSGKLDVLSGDISDIPERRKVADILDYLQTAASALTSKSSTLKITSLDSLCGLKVAVDRGTIVAGIAQDQATRCESSGKSLEVQEFGDQQSGILAVSSSRSDLTLVPTISGGYIASQSGANVKINGPQLGPTVYAGWAVRKDNALGPALLAAFKELYENGTLKQIYTKYGLQSILAAPGMNLQN